MPTLMGGPTTTKRLLAEWRDMVPGDSICGLPVVAAVGGLPVDLARKVWVSLWAVADTPSESRDAQVAILCLALAAVFLVLRHARFRFHQYQQAEATNGELRRMQSQLVQNEKFAAIGQLAAGVAHEMNTPIGFIACNVGTLQGYMQKVRSLLDAYEQLGEKVESADREQRLQVLERIKQLKRHMQYDFILKDLEGLFEDSKEGLDRVAKIIQSLRDFSRVDQVGDMARYNINEGMAATLTVARNELKCWAEIETALGDVPEILCNPGQINQVFLNVLVNAAQAIGEQGREDAGHMAIRTFAADGYVICEIEDDGPGIPRDTLGKIFDPFFTTKPPGTHTGMGLSVSYDIVVNRHKGQLLAESEEGQGTKLTIKLPLTPAKAAHEEPGPAPIGIEAHA